MKIAFLKFNKNNSPKVAALLSQYESVKSLISITNEDMFTTYVTLCIAANEADLQAMNETELSTYFKPFN